MSEEEIELKPCPFCGSTKLSIENSVCGHGDSETFIECESCGSRGAGSYPTEIKEIIIKWNTRIESK